MRAEVITNLAGLSRCIHLHAFLLLLVELLPLLRKLHHIRQDRHTVDGKQDRTWCRFVGALVEVAILEALEKGNLTVDGSCLSLGHRLGLEDRHDSSQSEFIIRKYLTQGFVYG